MRLRVFGLHQCIQEGVRYLMRMLQVRNSVKLNDGVVLHDTATANFLSEGTHVVTIFTLRPGTCYYLYVNKCNKASAL